MSQKREPVDGECPDNSDIDVWQTYKDYLKRKRDYKREWRKKKVQTVEGKPRRAIASATRKAPSSGSTKYITVAKEQQQQHQQPPSGMILEEEEDQSQGDGTDVEIEMPRSESLRLVILDEIDPDRQLQFKGDYDMEEVILDNETESEVVVSEEDEYFLDRWNAVSTRIMSVEDSNKRLRFLALIEGLVDEACRP